MTTAAMRLGLTMPRQTQGAYCFAVVCDPSSPSLARRLLSEWLESEVDAVVAQDAMLVLTELIANAVTHAGPARGDEIDVMAELSDDHLHLAVTDGGAHAIPRQRQPSSTREDGRGLLIVEQLATFWWWEPGPAGRGRTVHAALSRKP